MQNWETPNRGQLKTVPGIEQLTDPLNPIPGVAEIVGLEWLDQTFGDKKLIAYYRPNITLIPLPSVSSANFSTSGGTPVSYQFLITYVGPGGAVRSTTVITNMQADGVIFSLPAGVPDYVACIDIYARAVSAGADATYMWMGTMSRRNHVFPATISMSGPTRATTSGVVPEAVPNFFKAVPSFNTGNLIGGRQYYCAIAPYVSQTDSRQTSGGRNTRAYLSIGASFFAFTLPEANNAVTITFDWASAPAVAAGTNVNRWVLFIGTTPEDMMAVCSTTNGVIVPISDDDIRAGVEIFEIPYNSRNTVHMVSSGDMNQGGTGLDSSLGRDYGIFKNLSVAHGTTQINNEGGDLLNLGLGFFNLPVLGAWVLNSLPFSLADSYQLLPNVNERNFLRENPYVNVVAENQAMPAPMTFNDPASGLLSEISVTKYANRHYIANNQNVMFYTNGYAMKTVVRVDGGQYVPICQYIGLVNDKIALGGGSESFANTRNQVFYSETANPNSFGTTTWNTFPVNSGDGSTINGFGLYSQDLSTVGSQTFLLISKGGSAEALFSWNGLSGTDLVVSFLDRTGFAGPKAFTQTRYGPVFVSRHGAWLVSAGTTLAQIGDEVKTIFESLSEENLRKVNLDYVGTTVKVGYTDAADLDRELWIQVRQEGGGMEKFWTGPHVLQSFSDQASISFFQGDPDYRVSCLGADIFRRDTGSTNVGADINGAIVINRLGMNADHLRKLLNWIYLAVEIAQDETFTFTLTMQDGSVPFVFTGEALLAGGVEQFLQTRLVQRVVGRIVELKIETSSDLPISLFDISLLYNVQRRRRIGT